VIVVYEGKITEKTTICPREFNQKRAKTVHLRSKGGRERRTE
jgi:hypothetical protein